MGFVKKEAIVKVAEDFVEAQRQEALNYMREEAGKKLEEAMDIAKKTGDDFSYLDFSLTIPDVFQDAKGYYSVPEEIQAELAEAGFRVRWVNANRYAII